MWALASLGRAMAFTADADQARAVGEEALEYARKLGDERLLTHALQAMLWHSVASGASAGGPLAADELARLARGSGEWAALGMAAVFQPGFAYMHSDLDAWAGAHADLDRAVRVSGQPFLAYLRGCNDYARAFLRADFMTAEKVAEDSAGTWPLVRPGRHRRAIRAADVHGAPRDWRAGGGAASRAGRAGGGARGSPGFSRCIPSSGSLMPARSLLSRLLERLDPAPAQQAPWAQWTAVLVFLAEAAAALRDQDAARRIRPLLAPFTGLQLTSGHFVAVFGPADAYLAALDSVLGRHESAERLFERALAQEQAFGSVVHRAGITDGMGLASPRSRGCSSQRRYQEMRDEARRLAASLGLVRVMRRLEGDSERPAGLTPRELRRSAVADSRHQQP